MVNAHCPLTFLYIELSMYTEENGKKITLAYQI